MESTGSLVERWVSSSDLPNPNRLFSTGRFGELRSYKCTGAGGNWLGFITGYPPERHGWYYWERLNPGTSEASRHKRRETCGKPPSWETLYDHGLNVQIFDLNHTKSSKQIERRHPPPAPRSELDRPPVSG